MVFITRSRNDNGCLTIRGGVALDVAFGESFCPLLRQRWMNTRALGEKLFAIASW